MAMSPESREELLIIECVVKIRYLEERIKELKQEVRSREREKRETERYIDNRRLSICLAIASFLGGIVVKAVEWLILMIG